MRFFRRFKARKSRINVKFVSSLSTGAWRMRGEQLAAIYSNWSATQKLSLSDLQKIDVVVGVKRLGIEQVEVIKSSKIPLIYDLVDPWRQPEHDQEISGEAAARKLFCELSAPIRPDAYLFTTQQMKDDLEPALRPGILHRHHFDPRIKVQPIREKIFTIGYDGDPRFLGEWDRTLQELAVELGFQWTKTCSYLKSLDLVFIGRGAEYNSFLASRYKSNVKLANAMAAGIPALIQASQRGCVETSPQGVSNFFDDRKSLKALITRLQDVVERRRIREAYLQESPKYSAEAIAIQLETNLCKLIENQVARG